MKILQVIANLAPDTLRRPGQLGKVCRGKRLGSIALIRANFLVGS